MGQLPRRRKISPNACHVREGQGGRTKAEGFQEVASIHGFHLTSEYIVK
jgi:hypothetical protein